MDVPVEPAGQDAIDDAIALAEATLGPNGFTVVAADCRWWRNGLKGCRYPDRRISTKALIYGPRVVLEADGRYVYVHGGTLCDDPVSPHRDDPERGS